MRSTPTLSLRDIPVGPIDLSRLEAELRAKKDRDDRAAVIRASEAARAQAWADDHSPAFRRALELQNEDWNRRGVI